MPKQIPTNAGRSPLKENGYGVGNFLEVEEAYFFCFQFQLGLRLGKDLSNPGPDQSLGGNHFLPNSVKVLIHLFYVDTEVSNESYTHRYRTQIILKENYGL